MAVFALKLAPPFRLDLTVWVLRRLPINQMDRWDGQTYRRVLVLGDAPMEVEVHQNGPPQRPELTVTTRGGRIGSRKLRDLVASLEKMLGLNANLRPFYQQAEHDRRLADLIGPFVGFKPPRLPSVFETLLNAIACQQLSLTVGVHLLNRLCSAYGMAVGGNHAFPRPADLVSATPQDLRQLGFSGRKAQVMLDIAQAIVEGRLDLEALSALDDAAALDRLLGTEGDRTMDSAVYVAAGIGPAGRIPRR